MFDWNQTLTAIILFSSAFVHGVADFAFALVALPLLSCIMSLTVALPMIAVCGFLIHFVLLVSMRQDFKFARIRTLLFSPWNSPGNVSSF
ncbi:MAG TPA: hypothetical protein EYP57_06300 [Thermodesulfobacteriaceae bacterium]|nr:hypothetical protein [Thermodesulfobacteriaceae bacterium]